MPDPAEQLYGQFILFKSDQRAAPRGWNVETLGGWTLASHPKLPAHAIHTNDGHVGWLIGFAADLGGALVTTDVHWRDDAQVEESIYRYGGRFACVIITPQLARLYLDPCGSLAAVYSIDRPIVGSTSTVLSLDNPEYL